jgi:crotonobetainyl-CoA:carnitine CoA-transferase CaiB-like acyl-CoA transferase
MGPLFLHMNCSKRSMVLDLKKPGGREAMLEVLASSDVYIGLNRWLDCGCLTRTSLR